MGFVRPRTLRPLLAALVMSVAAVGARAQLTVSTGPFAAAPIPSRLACIYEAVRPRDSKPYAGLKDRSKAAIDRAAYDLGSTSGPSHEIRGSAQFNFDKGMRRYFLQSGAGRGFVDTTLEQPRAGAVLTRIRFGYEYELRGKDHELLEGWGRMLVFTESRDFAAGTIVEGHYHWSDDNPVRPLLTEARDLYYQSLVSERGFSRRMIDGIRRSDDQLPLAITEFYIVHDAGRAKGLFRIYNTRNDVPLPLDLAAGKPSAPIDPLVDLKPRGPLSIEVGNAYSAPSGGRRRYSSYWDFGWLVFIKRTLHQFEHDRDITINARAAGSAVSYFAQRYSFPVVKAHPADNSSQLVINGKDFVDKNERQIRDALPVKPSRATSYFDWAF